MKKGVLKYFAKFTRKHLCQCLFFNKVSGLRPVTLLKKRLWHRCFPVNFAKFLRTPFRTRLGDCFCHYQLGLRLFIDYMIIFNSLTCDVNFSSIYSNRVEISAWFPVMKLLHILVISILQNFCLSCEMKFYRQFRFQPGLKIPTYSVP